ncbi:MAG: GNAT family N-acetyltransferase, partial [Firmicutes bacterium]|nr:GNAT family N-acetyltransferase [Bacillota bacterium]
LALCDQEIIGYLVISRPDDRTRWGNARIPSLYEMEAIEVSRFHRDNKVATKLLDITYADPMVEAWIIISLEYAWHWDLANAGLEKERYRHMLHKLFEKVGFVEFHTDEPNILYDPNNIFMVRRGKLVPPDEWTAFEHLLVKNNGPFPQPPDRLIGPPLQGKHKRFYLDG